MSSQEPSPLILGNDLRNMSDATRAIIMNKEMIAVNQDPLGVQGWHCVDRDALQFWLKPLVDGAWAFTVLNTSTEDVEYAFNWQEINLTDVEVSQRSTALDTQVYDVYNLWTHKAEGKTSTKDKVDRTLSIKAHDVVSYRLTPRSGKK